MQRSGPAVAIAILFLVTAVFFLWVQGVFNVGSRKAYTHLHCPDCGLQTIYQATKEGAPCPQCGPGSSMVPTVGSWHGHSGGDVGLAGKVMVAVFGALLASMAALYGWILRERARRREEQETQNQMHVCLCPFCSRRIGYPANKIGSGALCPRCKTGFALPEGVLAEEAD